MLTPNDVIRSIAQSKIVQGHIRNSDKKSYVTGFAIASIVAKDAVGCYYYVKQSLANEKIPEDKRKFVASLDLANGVLMITSQVLLTLLFQPILRKVFDKHIAKRINFNKIKDAVFKRVKPEEIARKGEVLIRQRISDTTDKFKDTVFAGFDLLGSLVISTILAKRVIVPFLSTPLASCIKDKYLEKNKKCPQENGHGRPQPKVFKEF
ncbi:MAG: hypothetical protein PHX18_03570 [Candidatus Gastranaerophilales bacterium]|nr:hypothetical protein [Candidatus Gastranaerophilales bacterium]